MPLSPRSPRPRRFLVPTVAAILAAVGLSATGCATVGGAAAKSGKSVSVVGFSVLQKANTQVFKDFQQTSKGKGVTFKTSYGASGDQSRAVAKGLKADEVHFSLEPDMTRLVESGQVAKDWNQGANKGVVTQSVVVFVVRKGNPKNIKTWDDLIKPGVKVITPNPGSSGSAKWNILAAYGSQTAQGASRADATAYLKKLVGNVVSLPGSAHDATTAFNSGTGDVLLSYENEAIEGRQSGLDFDYVVPPQTLLIQNPGATTTKAGQAAKDFLAYQVSERGQTEYAKEGFRPLQSGVKTKVEGANDPSHAFPKPQKLLTIDTFGGWSKADKLFFDDKSGLVTTLLANSGKA